MEFENTIGLETHVQLKSLLPIQGMSRRYGMPLSNCSSVVRERPPMTAVVPSAIAKSVTSRCTSITGYFAE